MVNETLATVVMSFMASDIPPTEQECLALNVYHEARNQSSLGQMAVALVTLNRVEDARYPSNICSVVKQRGYKDPLDAPIVIGRCQWSWFCDGKSDDPTDTRAYDTAMTNAAHAYHMYSMDYDVTEGSTHYHSREVDPNWVSDMTHVVDIDDHMFYRWE